MTEVLKQLQKEREEAQALLNHYEDQRDMMPRGSASWRSVDNEAQLYRGKIFGLDIAIRAIKREGATK